MSLVKLRAKRLPALDHAPDMHSEEMEPIRRWAGWFNTETAIHWAARDANNTERVWLTPSGRWVLTTRTWDSYITVDEARWWLAGEGHIDAIREHIAVERDGRGRPEIGPEVKFRIPKHVRDSVDALAAANGVTRADQLRVIVMDTVLRTQDKD